jgi:hypothetical protein
LRRRAHRCHQDNRRHRLSGCALEQDGAFLGGLASLARTLKLAYPTFRLSRLRDDGDAVFQAIRALDPTAKIAVNNEDIDDLANGMRSGKVVLFNVTAIKHDDVLERLKRDWGISNPTANLDGWRRWIESRLTDAEMRTGISLVLGLPQVDDPQLASAGPAAAAASAPACVCGAKGDANPPTGDHAFLCKKDTMKQRAATATAAALAFVVQGLPGIKLYGRGRVHGSLRVRPDEPTFRHAAITIGAALVTPADADRRFDIGFTANGVQNYVGCLKTATISGSNIKQACQVQGDAAEAGD